MANISGIFSHVVLGCIIHVHGRHILVHLRGKLPAALFTTTLCPHPHNDISDGSRVISRGGCNYVRNISSSPIMMGKDMFCMNHWSLLIACKLLHRKISRACYAHLFILASNTGPGARKPESFTVFTRIFRRTHDVPPVLLHLIGNAQGRIMQIVCFQLHEELMSTNINPLVQ